MLVAIIDMGTNTFHCLIVKISGDGSFQKLYKTKNSVKLGENGINKNFIQEEPFKRGLATLKEYKIKIDEYEVEKTYAYGTAALRSANNSAEFIEAVYKETGICVEIISGELEAEYIYLGVRTALDMGDKNSLVMDIGGGSVEFIIADKNNIKWSHSFDLGAARLLDKFKPTDPISREEIMLVENYLETNLQKLFIECKRYEPQTLIGSSGSFDTFAELIAYEYYSPKILKNKTEYIFNIEEYKNIHHIILTSQREDRAKMKGLTALRIDMIVLASIFVNLIIKKLNISEMKLSTHAMKEGILWSILEK